MAKWKMFFAPEAEDDLEKLTISIRKRVIKKIEWLQNNFDDITPLGLGGSWQGFFKIRS